MAQNNNSILNKDLCIFKLVVCELEIRLQYWKLMQNYARLIL